MLFDRKYKFGNKLSLLPNLYEIFMKMLCFLEFEKSIFMIFNGLL